MLQGEADLRCPTSDAEQLFVALRWLGRDVSYVLYPEGDHAITGSTAPTGARTVTGGSCPGSSGTCRRERR